MIKELKEKVEILEEAGELSQPAITIYKTGSEQFSAERAKEGNLRFLYCTNPIQITTSQRTIFAAERSAIKVHPYVELEIAAELGSTIYEVCFHANESEFLEGLMRSEGFPDLEGRAKEEWESLRGQDLDYVLAEERNAKHILRSEGVVVAPPHSRFNSMVGNGWHLMYTRGSRAVAVGSNVLWELRSEESPHYHKITREIYLVLGGVMEFDFDGEVVQLSKDQVAVAKPKTVHCMKKIIESPYRGLTLQIPSVPGDRYSP